MKKLKTIFFTPRTYALAAIAQSLTLAFIVLMASVFAQQPTQPKPIALTAEEQQQGAQVLAVEKQRGDAMTVAVNDLLNTQPGPDSVTVHARYQSAWLALRLAQTERAVWLERLRGKAGCPDCLVSEDGKGLVRPTGAK